MPEQATRSPHSGDPLILIDGRRFVIDSAEQTSRGWWFKATAQDESCVLQGNLTLQWDVVERAWRPVSREAATATVPRPPSMERPPQRRAKQTE